jgi:hypothetical protein
MKKIHTFRGLKGENEPSESPETEFGAQNQYGRVIYPSIGNFTWTMKNVLLGTKRQIKRPPELKNGIWGPKSVWSCDISIERKFCMQQKNKLWGVKKAKISIQSLKTEFGALNQYGRVTYPSFGNFTFSKKKCTMQGRKSENKPSELQNIKNKCPH